MEIELCTKSDFNQILTDIVDFWGSDWTLSKHHPMFIYEFGNTAFVIKDKEKVVAYLFGFFSQTNTTGYVHLIGVRHGFRRQGLAKRLYDKFTVMAKHQGCDKLKAITTLGNTTSLSFHKTLGMRPVGETNKNGIAVVKDYSGPGEDRVVLEMEI